MIEIGVWYNFMTMAKDFYATLGVSKGASDDEIKKAYRKLAHEHHPDKGGNTEKFKEINEAYQTLSDKQKRAQYDQFGANYDQMGGGGNPFGGGAGGFGNFNFGGDFGDIFSQFGFGGGMQQQDTRGEDVLVDLSLTLHDVAFGVTKDISLYLLATCDTCEGDRGEKGSTKKTCDTCKGKGQVVQVQRTILGNMQSVAMCEACVGRGTIPEKKCKTCKGDGVYKQEMKTTVKIPAGVEDGAQVRVRGKGAASEMGGSSGDLYVRIHVEKHKTLVREGSSIYSKVFVPFSMMIEGGVVGVETIEGMVDMKVPEHTESGQVIRLKEKGVARLQSSGRGDHFVTVQVDVPKKLSREQKKLVEELGKNGL